jgi:hypothetical protein
MLRNLLFCFPKAKLVRVLNKRKKKITEMLETFPYDKKQKKIFFKSFEAKKYFKAYHFVFHGEREGKEKEEKKKVRKNLEKLNFFFYYSHIT